MSKISFFIMICLMTIGHYVQAKCTVNPLKSKLEYTGFKTAAKVGVKGSFSQVKYNFNNKAKSFANFLSGSTASIDTSSMKTGNPVRDKRIIDTLFANLAVNNKIETKILNLKGTNTGSLDLEITLNGVKAKVPMKWEYMNEMFQMNGSLNILQFNMFQHLQALNKACFDLHNGNTWADVALSFNSEIKCK